MQDDGLLTTENYMLLNLCALINLSNGPRPCLKSSIIIAGVAASANRWRKITAFLHGFLGPTTTHHRCFKNFLVAYLKNSSADGYTACVLTMRSNTIVAFPRHGSRNMDVDRFSPHRQFLENKTAIGYGSSRTERRQHANEFVVDDGDFQKVFS